MTNNPRRFFTMLFTALLFLAACKKDKPDVAVAAPAGGSANGGTVSATSAQQVMDSSLLVSRNLYLWNTQIPATFNASNYADPAAMMKAIQPFSIEAGFSAPVDKWSFAMKQKEWDLLSEGMGSLVGNVNGDGDFGMSVFFRTTSDLRVRLVEPNSPAGKAGVRRGWRITKINSNANISTATSNQIVADVYEASNTSFEFTRPDGSLFTTTLNVAHYAEKPVYLDTVYNRGAQRIGYLVFNSFLGKTTEIRSAFQRVFSNFANQQVTDVVVDLRYNGGGYVSLAENLANYLAPSSANGALMMNQIYNSQNSRNNLATYIRKTGTLELSNIYFIVSKSTASSSELLINNLKPYMNVKLIGPNATHGKPVGFFPTPVGEWYVFPVSFRTTNKNGEGNYFNGLPVNAAVSDGLDKDWGDPAESCLAAAIRNITTGRYARENQPYIPSAEIMNSNELLDMPFIKIAIASR